MIVWELMFQCDVVVSEIGRLLLHHPLLFKHQSVEKGVLNALNFHRSTDTLAVKFKRLIYNTEGNLYKV